MEIRYIKHIEDIPGCHLFFVAETTRKNLNRIEKAARASGFAISYHLLKMAGPKVSL